MNQEKFNKLILKERINTYKPAIIILSATIVFFSFFLVVNNPETSELLQAVVISAGATHGMDGSYAYLKCKLDKNNKIVTVHLDGTGPIQKGKSVILSKITKTFGGESYKFVKYASN